MTVPQVASFAGHLPAKKKGFVGHTEDTSCLNSLWGNGRVLVALQICGKRRCGDSGVRNKRMRRNTYLGKNPRSWVTSFCNQGLSRGRDLWYLHARQCVDSGFLSRGETFSGWTRRKFWAHAESHSCCLRSLDQLVVARISFSANRSRR